MAIVYVDPQNGDDSAGDGSSSSPYASISGAITNGTWSTTEGNFLRLANTAPDVLSATINFSSIVSIEAPLVVEGWDNGGSITGNGPFGSTISPCGEIDGNDAVAYISAINTAYVLFKNIKMHSTTSRGFHFLSSFSTCVNCEMYDFGGGYYSIYYGQLYNCKITAANNAAGGLYSVYHISNCEINGNGSSIGFRTESGSNKFDNNLIYNFGQYGAYLTTDGNALTRNTIDGQGCTDASCAGIYAAGSNVERSHVQSNLLTNFDTVSGAGIRFDSGSPPFIVDNNAFYNNTSDTDISNGQAINSITETSDPYTDAVSNDYSLVDGALSKDASIMVNGTRLNVGAYQDDSSTGGSSGPTERFNLNIL